MYLNDSKIYLNDSKCYVFGGACPESKYKTSGNVKPL